jgi:hypothetical protein
VSADPTPVSAFKLFAVGVTPSGSHGARRFPSEAPACAANWAALTIRIAGRVEIFRALNSTSDNS